jgi:hypothetical protein
MENSELNKRTRKDLLALAKQYQLKGVSHLRKKELIDKLLASMPAQPASVSHQSPTAAKVAPSKAQEEAPVSVAAASPSVSEPERPDPSLRAQPVNEAQQQAMDCKFFLGPHVEPTAATTPELPSVYDDNRLVLLARDPYWLHAYWDFSVERMSAVRTQLGAQDVRPVLRVFDVTYLDFNGTNAWNSMDIELTPFATNWYIPVSQPDAAYCVEFGYRAADGRFAALGRSNVVTTPRAEPSPSSALRWFTPPERQASPVPPPQSPPLQASLPTWERSSWPLGLSALPPLPAPSSAEHPFSWSTVRKA